jgi:hypothetical protein
MSDVDSAPDDGLNQWLADYRQDDLSVSAIVRELGRDAASWDLSTRLKMRSSPIFHLTGFRHRVHKLALDLGRVGALTRDLDLAGDLTRDLTHSSARDRARDLTRDLTRPSARARDVLHDLELVRNLDRVRGYDLAYDLGVVRDLAVDLARALNLVRDLAHARERALAYAHALGLTLTYGTLSVLVLGFGLSFAHTLTLIRDRDRDVYQAITRARDRALILDRAFERVLDCNDTITALISLHHALSDVTNHDLRGIDLAGISLEGLRWSAQTQWPSQWKDWIQRDSVEVTNGTFQVMGRRHDVQLNED